MKINVGTPRAYQTPRYVTLNVAAPGPLAAFTASDDSALTATKGGNPAGTVTLNSDGSFTYVPSGGFTGFDVFTITAHSGDISSDPVNVIITVGFAAASPCGECSPCRKVDYTVEAQIGPVGFFPFLNKQPFRRFLTMSVHAELHKTNSDGRTINAVYDGTKTVNPKNGSCQYTEHTNFITLDQPGHEGWPFYPVTGKWTDGFPIYMEGIWGYKSIGSAEGFPGTGSSSGGDYYQWAQSSWKTTDDEFTFVSLEDDSHAVDPARWSGNFNFVETLSEGMDYGGWLGLLKALLTDPPDPPWAGANCDWFMYDSPSYANAGGGPPSGEQWIYGYGCSGFLDDSIVHNARLVNSVAVGYEAEAYVSTSNELIRGRISKSVIYGCGCLGFGTGCVSFPIVDGCGGARQVIPIGAPDFPGSAVDTDIAAYLSTGNNLNLGSLCINNACQDVTTPPDIGSSDPD